MSKKFKGEHLFEDRYDDFYAQARAWKVQEPGACAAEAVFRVWERSNRGVDELAEDLVGLILHGCIVDALRKQSRHAQPIPGPGEGQDQLPAPSAPATIRDLTLRSSLLRELKSIDIQDAVPWALVNLHGLTQAEAAIYLGIPQQRVSERAERCRVLLRHAIDRAGV